MKKQPTYEERYNELVKEFTDAGFTEKQAVFIINLLNNYIPLI